MFYLCFFMKTIQLLKFSCENAYGMNENMHNIIKNYQNYLDILKAS